MFAELPRKTLKLWVYSLTSIVFIQPAAAQTAADDLPCDPPSGLEPLFTFLNSITELAFLAGVGLATLTFVVAGTCLIIPGQDYNRLGKNIAKNGFIGAVLLLSANMITSYLVSQLGGSICA
ncbi:pilin [Halovenus sp. HT40]|uniref:pilin n=1 Tax=Halovenus sp. HT40 TaxID=3126691 RepID=UPI00300E7DC5